MTTHIKRFTLKALASAGAVAFREHTLISAVQIAVTPRPTDTDVRTAIQDLETGGYITRLTNQFDGEITVSLTEKGRHQLAQP